MIATQKCSRKEKSMLTESVHVFQSRSKKLIETQKKRQILSRMVTPILFGKEIPKQKWTEKSWTREKAIE